MSNAKTTAKKIWDHTKTPVLLTALVITSLVAAKETRHARFQGYYLAEHGLLDSYNAQSDAEVLRLIARNQ